MFWREKSTQEMDRLSGSSGLGANLGRRVLSERPYCTCQAGVSFTRSLFTNPFQTLLLVLTVSLTGRFYDVQLSSCSSPEASLTHDLHGQLRLGAYIRIVCLNDFRDEIKLLKICPTATLSPLASSKSFDTSRDRQTTGQRWVIQPVVTWRWF